jgi:hypothetical protein
MIDLRPHLVHTPRPGPRPLTRASLPHVQLNQWPPADVHSALLDQCTNLPHIAVQQSRMGLPDTLALRVVDKFAHGAPEAFIDDHEFCHLHALPEGSIHLALPDPARQEAVSLGWVEPHPAAGLTILPATLVLLYAPRDAQEVQVALGFIKISLAFAEGRVADLQNLL